MAADSQSFSSAQIVALRPQVGRPLPSDQPLSTLTEMEPDRELGPQKTLTVFLRGSECRFRCLMCDLWKYTTGVEKTEVGSIPKQVQFALESVKQSALNDEGPKKTGQQQSGQQHSGLRRSGPQDFDSEAAKWIKLYNASNFFADYNLPEVDLPRVASLVDGFERVIVENHPRLLNETIPNFRRQLAGRLEVAMGLETIHPESAAMLNKQMTPADFARACDWLHRRDVDARAFVLLRLPDMSEEQGRDWAIRSVQFAVRSGARHVSVIPMRFGNGAIDLLRKQGRFEPPQASSLETVLEQCLAETSAIVTVDLWDWGKLPGHCSVCSAARLNRIERMNLTQSLLPLPPVACGCIQT